MHCSFTDEKYELTSAYINIFEGMSKDLNPGLSDFKAHVLSVTACFPLRHVLLFTVCCDELGKSAAAAAAVKLFQSCPTLCDRIDGSPPGSPIPGILQAGTLEWVAISFSNA